MKLLISFLILVLFGVLGCSDGSKSATSALDNKIIRQKSAASFRIAINDPEVDKVTVDISADDIDTISTNLTIVNDTAVGIIGDILIGNNRKFSVSAYKGILKSHYGDTVATIVESDTTEVPVNLAALYGSATFTIPISESFPGVIDSIYVMAINGADTLRQKLASGVAYTGELTEIPIGEDVEFSVYVASEGEIKYEGHATANVNEGQPVDITLNINPVIGSAEILASINTGWEGAITGEINETNGYQIISSLFSEDYESYDLNTLPGDYIIVYSGAGTSEQIVESDGENKYLHTAGRSSWGLAMRKDFVEDYPNEIEVSWKMQTQTSYNSTNYSTSGVASVGSFSVKNEAETYAGLGLGNKDDDEMYVYAWDPVDEVSYTVMVNRNEWVDCSMVIDFVNQRYDAYVNGELLAENLPTTQVDLTSTWNSYGEDASFRFSSGNHSSTTTLFDDISISEILIQ